MRPFRFRADAVLTLRRKAEDAAREALARAIHAQTEADRAREVAEHALAAARGSWMAAQQQGVDGAGIGWHRSWIVRLQTEAETRRRAADAAAATVQRAAASVAQAHQRRRMLERLRERAWQRHQRESARAAERVMNELASVRYAARLREHEEPDREY